MSDFKEWLKLQEVGTGTNSVAVFARPMGIGTVTRSSLEPITMSFNDDKEEDNHKKHKKHKHKV